MATVHMYFYIQREDTDVVANANPVDIQSKPVYGTAIRNDATTTTNDEPVDIYNQILSMVQ